MENQKDREQETFESIKSVFEAVCALSQAYDESTICAQHIRKQMDCLYNEQQSSCK